MRVGPSTTLCRGSRQTAPSGWSTGAQPRHSGWGEYYKKAHLRKLFHQLDHWIFHRIWSHHYKRWRNTGWKWWPTSRQEAMDPLYRNWRAVWRMGLLLSRDTKTLGMVQVFERRTGWARRVAPTINAIGRSAEGRLARYPERSRDRPRHSVVAVAGGGSLSVLTPPLVSRRS